MIQKTFWIINQTAGSAHHGMVFRNYYIAKEWVSQGHRAVIISSSYFHNFSHLPQTKGLFTREMIDGIEYWWVKMPHYSQSRSLGRLFSIFLFPLALLLFPIWRLPKPDTIILSGPPHVPILNVWVWSRIYCATLVYEVRDIWPMTIEKLGGVSRWHPVIVFLAFLERLAYMLSDRVVSVLALAWRHFESRGMSPAKFAYIPNGVERSQGELLESETSRIVAQIAKEKFTVIYTGSLGIANNLDQLIDAANVLQTNNGIHFVLVGAGPHKAKLVEKTKHLTNVTILPSVPKKEIPGILAEAHLCYIGLQKSPLFLHGISPNKLFDYMAAAKPVLMAIDTEDDIVTRAGCGESVASCDPKDIAQKIVWLKELGQCRLVEMGEKGREYLDKHHTYDALAAKYVRIAEEGKKPIEQSSRWAMSPFLLGFSFVMLAGLFFHLVLPLFYPDLFKDGMTSFLTDIHLFHKLAVEATQLNWSEWWLHKTFLPSKVMSFIYKLTGISRPVMFLPMLAALAGLTLRLQAAILDILGVRGRWWPVLIAFFFTVTPTSFSWMIYPHKDAFIVPGFLLVVWSLLACSIRRPRFRHVPALLVGFWLMFFDKAYFAQILAVGVIASLGLVWLRSHEPIQKWGRVSFFLFTLILLFWVSSFADNYGAGVEDTPQNQNAAQVIEANMIQDVPRHHKAMEQWNGFGGPKILDVPFKRIIFTRERFLSERPYGDTNFMPEQHISSSWQALAFMPRALQLALLEPGPWRSQWDEGKARGLVFLALQVEMILFYFLLIFLMISGSRLLKTEVLICLFLAIPFLLALGYAMPNIGTINRYRFPFLLLIKLAGFAALWAADRHSLPGRLLMWVDPPKKLREKKRVLFLVPDDATFIVQRLVMARSVQEAGYDVHVACPDLGHAQRIRELGFTHHNIDLNRGGLNPFADLTAFIRLIFFLARIRPDILQNVSIKPVVYGSTAAAIVGVRRVVNLVNGMGYAFDKVGLKGTVVYYIAVALYRNALAMPGIRVIFQNPTDRQYFIDHKLVDENKTILIRGSGVDMNKFTPSPLPSPDIPTVLFVGRLLWSKGLKELIEAAQLVRKKGTQFNLMIVGEPDDRNPGAVPLKVLEQWHADSWVNWVGRQSDMPAFYRQADVVCLPSNYREGLPLTLLEAASMGRPLVTTDMPGCREAVIDGMNGFLVPPQNAPALAEALYKLLSDRDLREKMGRASSKLVEENFSSLHVKRQLLAVYDTLFLEADQEGDADWNGVLRHNV